MMNLHERLSGDVLEVGDDVHRNIPAEVCSDVLLIAVSCHHLVQSFPGSAVGTKVQCQKVRDGLLKSRSNHVEMV